MTLDRARKRFLYTHARKDGLEKESQSPCMAILRSLKVLRTRKAARHLFFKAIKRRGATQLSHDATTHNGSARRPPWHSKFKRTSSGYAHEYAPCSLAEFSLEREFFLEGNCELYFFILQARGENCMLTVGGSLIDAHFLTRGNRKSSRNKGECFDINRAKEWVQARQSFPDPPWQRSAAQHHRDSARRRSSARATPKSHAKVRHSDYRNYARPTT